MPRSDEATVFFHAVYCAVQEIPYGKVTTYGHIAMLVGTRKPSPIHLGARQLTATAQRPRQVGVCMKHLPADTTSRFNNGNVPWQRVINAKGGISPRCVICIHACPWMRAHKYRSQPSGARNQAAALRAEGVEVKTGALGELSVDFGEYGWFPEELPSEAGENIEDDSQDDG